MFSNRKPNKKPIATIVGNRNHSPFLLSSSRLSSPATSNHCSQPLHHLYPSFPIPNVKQLEPLPHPFCLKISCVNISNLDFQHVSETCIIEINGFGIRIFIRFDFGFVLMMTAVSNGGGEVQENWTKLDI
ncbi:unnamed protein product [Lactuca virosa]|uniref:Uncharacterized protein n=1 Tax=Lactuca virosa TaxID=75947 RepID=A0AAU9LHK6_9ASTR|nr:unnamed protein product [Lactuca virosa]